MQQAAFTLDGRKVAYSKGRPIANVWRVPIPEGREAVWADAEQLTFDTSGFVQMELQGLGGDPAVGDPVMDGGERAGSSADTDAEA